MNRTMVFEEGGVATTTFVQRAAAWFRSGATAGQRRMRHLETLPLGRNQSLYLVECEGMRFLVSAGGDSLSAPVPLPAADARVSPVTMQPGQQP